MPQFEMDLSLPEKDEVTVRPAEQYATLWSQFLSDVTGSTLLYYLFGPFFFIRFVIVSFYAPSIVLVTNPQVYPIQIPSTATNVPKTPIAYTSDDSYESITTSYIGRIIRLPSLLFFTGKTYLRRERIAYIVLDSTATQPQVNADEFFITEDDDSLRPIILFRD